MSSPPPTVQLLHELPDGTVHVDWMIAQDPDAQEPLITFRAPRRIDELAPGEQLGVTRIADHRPAYLTYEGPISKDRGSVRRLAHGTVVALERRPRRWRLELRWHVSTGPARPQWLRLDRSGPDRWLVTATGPGPRP